MTNDQLAIVKQRLADDFVPRLPPLVDENKPAEHLAAKKVAPRKIGVNWFVLRPSLTLLQDDKDHWDSQEPHAALRG